MAKNDLLPDAYRRGRCARRALRGWAAGAAVCGLAAGAAVVSGVLRSAPLENTGVSEQIAVAERRAADSHAQAAELSEQLSLHRRAASAVDSVAEQPDWRILIERVSQELGSQVVLTQVRLGALEGSELAQVVDGDAPDAVWVVLGGVAGNYTEVSGLVLRLEAVGLFTQVHLVETGRQNFAGEARIGFRIVCRVQ